MPYNVNGSDITVEHEPRVKDGVMWVPLRALTQAMGGSVDFDPTTHSPIVYMGSNIITVTSGNADVDVNGQKVTLAAPPFIYEGDTFVPVRLFENLPGVQLTADPASLQVTLNQT